MINFVRVNWGIYESDIYYLGGTVQYTGNVITKSRRSCLEEAVVTLQNVSCVVLMERFRKGNAAICKFVNSGKVIVRLEEYPDASLFMNTFNMLAEHNDVYLECSFVRRAKQYGTFALQIVCCLTALLSIVYCAINTVSAFGVSVFFISLVLLIVFGGRYSEYRMMDLGSYVLKFLNED